ncbi:hypothetical protein CAPTEDRAFT_188686 [Capitella teleta]|nr:hypothetical protein CAPTEDRAFT_188686 [Capitella teleta]|eukprot:ELT92313.1 hypothetical protein CAPTEDRAFT_188686 [Capitella teleta]
MKEICQDEIFTFHQDEKNIRTKRSKPCNPKRILLEGDPGMGKTTLCQDLAFRFANSKKENENEFDELLNLINDEDYGGYIVSLCSSPLNLAIICLLISSGGLQKITTRTELYKSVTKFLVKKATTHLAQTPDDLKDLLKTITADDWLLKHDFLIYQSYLICWMEIFVMEAI